MINDKLLVVGVGGAEGSIDPFLEIVQAMKNNSSISVVFVHNALSSVKQSVANIFKLKNLQFKICEIKDGMELEPNTIYISPAGKDCTIIQDTFNVSEPKNDHTHFPIDNFFISLARAKKELAVGFVLSGNGNDGSRGIQEIRNLGGIVIVQDPITAEYTAMPQSAIQTNVADHVLNPREMAATLEKIILSFKQNENDQLSNIQKILQLLDIVYNESGYNFKSYKNSVISRRINRRTKLHGITSLDDYIEFVNKNKSEVYNIISDLMIGVTSFFRDYEYWDLLKTEVLEKLIKSNSTNVIRIWAPACATGEEAYSIAMMVHFEASKIGRFIDYKVFASDINDLSIDKARLGKYPINVTADIPQEYAKAFLSYSDDGQYVSIDRDIREHIVFAKQNLLTDPPFSKIDLVICRNLLIYLESDMQQKVLEVFHYSLNPQGYLFLGSAETIGKNENLFKSVNNKKIHIYERLQITKPAKSPTKLQTLSAVSKYEPYQMKVYSENSSQSKIQTELLNEYGPIAIGVDKNYRIIYSNGSLDKYFRFTKNLIARNLFELIPPDLVSQIKQAFSQIESTKKPVMLNLPFVISATLKENVTLKISKVKCDTDVFLIVFESGKLVSSEIPSNDSPENQTVHNLESELVSTRENLELKIEQLRCLNEELQLSNEELETSQEELQSLNEELIVVNQQLQTKIEEQEELTSDLSNFLSSTDIPTLFLDSNLRVHLFTPAMTRLVKLLRVDIGRPLADLSQEFIGPNFFNDASHVLKTHESLKSEMKIKDTWYIRSISPYYSKDKMHQGIVITYIDITERKNAEYEIESARLKAIQEKNKIEAIIKVLPIGIAILDEKGGIVECNKKYTEIWGNPDPKAQDVDDYASFKAWWVDTDEEVKPEEWASAIAVNKKETVVGQLMRIRGFDGQFKYVYNGAAPILSSDNKVIGCVVAIQDISELRDKEEAVERSEALLRSVLDQMPSGVIIQDTETKEVLLSNAKSKEILTQLLLDESHDSPLSNYLNTDKVIVSEEVKCMKRNNNLLYLNVSSAPVQNNFGQIKTTVAVFDDITERKKAEQLLFESELLYRTLASNIPNGAAFILDRNLRYVLAAGQALLKANLEPKDLEGKTIYEALSKEIVEKYEPLYQNIFRGIPFKHEHHDNGRYYITEGVPIKVGENEISYILVMSYDITERKETELQLEDSNRRISDILASIQDGFLVLDKNWNFVYINKKAANNGGFEPEELIGQNIWDKFSYLKGSDLALNYQKVMEDKIPIHHEFKSLVKNKYYNVSIYPSKEGITVYWTDLTDRKILEEELKKRALDLANANKELESFSYSVSHDLRAPIRSMIGFSELLLEDYYDRLDEDGKQYIDRIKNSGKKMNELIEDMLMLSKVNRQEIKIEDVDITFLSQDILEDIKNSRPQRNVQIIIQDNLQAKGDFGLLKLALTNLLENAWKYTSKVDPSIIKVGSVYESNNEIFYVKDNGAGFDMRYSEKLFVPFQRLHSDVEFPGTGIGLAIVERVVNKHGGRIWAESEIGKGTTFYFYFG